LSEVAFEQKLNEQVLLDLVFRDETGKSVQLGDYFGQKPVILTLNYYNCPMLCPLVLEELITSLAKVPFTMGDQFNVVTVSIDPRETPELAAATKKKYIQRYDRPGVEEGWHFLTGEEISIQRLAQAVGFRYAYDAQSDQYAHPAGIIVLTPEGKISRYFYGLDYSPTDLRLGLVEASANKIGSLVDQVLLRCYHYDPVSGRYTLVVMNILRLAGLATVLILGAFTFMMFRHERRKKIEPQELKI
jgi:protein SCO1/2